MPILLVASQAQSRDTWADSDLGLWPINQGQDRVGARVCGDPTAGPHKPLAPVYTQGLSMHVMLLNMGD